MRKITSRAAAIASGAVLAVAGSTAAFAYANGWFSGNGNVYGTGATIQTVHAEINTSGVHLYPGKDVPVNGPVSNPNEYPVLITAIAVNDVTSDKPTCGKNEAKLTFAAVPANTVIPAGQTPGTVGLGTLHMDGDANALCAGANFTITANLTGEIAPA